MHSWNHFYPVLISARMYTFRSAPLSWNCQRNVKGLSGSVLPGIGWSFAGLEKIPLAGGLQERYNRRENQAVNLMEHPIVLEDAVSIDLPVSMVSRVSASLNTGATTMVLA